MTILATPLPQVLALACAWLVIGALGLLRDARAHDGRDLVGEFQGHAGFRDVKDDPEFLQAISRSRKHQEREEP